MSTKRWATRLLNSLVSTIVAFVLLAGTPVGFTQASPSQAAAEESASAPASQIVAGGTHTCALTPEGSVVCWGANSNGQLGDGVSGVEGDPTPGLAKVLHSGVTSLSLAWGRTCALTATGRVYCWGKTAMPNGDPSSTPIEVTGLGSQVVQLAVGEMHVCARTLPGKVMCWGYNGEGGLGNGTTSETYVDTPVVAIPSGAVDIAVYGYTSCAVLSGGRVKCWGDGSRGQLGNGQTNDSSVPVAVIKPDGSPLENASKVSMGVTHACALVNGGVQCWGNNRWGQLGNGIVLNSPRPYALPVLTAAGDAALSGVDQLKSGEDHVCVRLSAGTARCWGRNFIGQVGNGATSEAVSLPTDVKDSTGAAPLTGVTLLAAGMAHTCVFTSWETSHPFYCWGHDGMGQLGQGTITGQQTLPQVVSDISQPSAGGTVQQKRIIAGGAHTCSFTSAEGLKCWGSNSHGQLGDGTTADSQVPLVVTGLGSDVDDLALGQNFTCAVLPWGRLKCWGDNTHGQLGDGTKTDQPVPVLAALTGVTVRQVAAGDSHACALTVAGSVLCWGNNASGQAGSVDLTDQAAPVTVIASGAKWVAAGGSTSCAVLSGGTVQCWGSGDQGQLGDGGSGSGHSSITPSDVQLAAGGALADASQVDLGDAFGCALRSDGAPACWGKNDVGQLGQGSTSALSASALSVLAADGNPLTGVFQIDTGGAHACAHLYTNRLKCWGEGTNGELGNGLTGAGASSATPRTVLDHYEPYAKYVPYLEGVAQVSAGGIHTCAYLTWSDPLPYRCWGGNASGQLGDGVVTGGAHAQAVAADDKPYPNPVGNILSFGGPPLAKVAAGDHHTCALTSAGAVLCWGWNSQGELGDGTTTDSAEPVHVTGLDSGVVSLSAGVQYSCALTAAGGVKCWGSVVHSNTPVDIPGLTSGVIEMDSGDDGHVCVLTSVGGVKCWGSNAYGQLGNNTTTDQSSPVDVSNLTSQVIGISMGSNFSCALTSSGAVKCWGKNDYGQLGNMSSTNSSIPVDVYGLGGGVIGLAAGGFHSCALLPSSLKCWGGDFFGQLGAGYTTAYSFLPVDVAGLDSFSEVHVGAYHTCAVTTAGVLKCWGFNPYGQLGDGTTADRNTPVNVSGGLTGASSITIGDGYTCAAFDGLTPLSCWGINDYGQFGDGTTVGSTTPKASKWLTADGLVEDQKTTVIIPPIANTAVVIPAQPVETPTVITATVDPIPPVPPQGEIIPDGVVIDIDEKLPVDCSLWWFLTSSHSSSAGAAPQAGLDYDENTLNVYKYFGGAWVPLLPCTGCSLDKTNGILKAVLPGPGKYAVMASTGGKIYLPLVTH